MKRFLFKIGIAAVTLVLSVVVLELCLRALGFHYDLYLTKLQFGFPNPSDLVERFQPDPDLLWVPKDYPQRLELWRGKAPAIAFMGCSCTELGTYDRCFKDLLDQRHPGNSFQYVNLGVSGWTTYEGLQQFRRDVVRLRPRIITVYYGWNDHWKNFGVEDKDMARFIKHSPTAATLSKFRIVQLLNSVYVRQVLQKSRAPQARVSLDDFSANLLAIVREARTAGMVPLLLTAPSAHIQGQEPKYLAQRWLTDLNQLVPIHRKYAEVVRSMARQENVLLVDLAQEFEALSKDFVVNECFHADGIHLTPKGDQVIADSLYRHLAQAGLLDKVLYSEPVEKAHLKSSR